MRILLVSISILLLVGCSARKLPKTSDFSGKKSVQIDLTVASTVSDQTGPKRFAELLAEELRSKGYSVCLDRHCDADIKAELDVRKYSHTGSGSEIVSHITMNFSAYNRAGKRIYNYPLDYARDWPQVRHEQHLVASIGRFFPFRPAKVLVLPVRDVVQGGLFHEKGEGSGGIVTRSIVEHLTILEPVTTSNPDFDHHTVATPYEARAEAKRLGATYYLRTILGEFRNAAPMTFRTDYVGLESAAMYRADNGQIVWQARVPYVFSGTNLGNHLGYLEAMGKHIAEFIIRGYSPHVRGERRPLPRVSFPNGGRGEWKYSSRYASLMDLVDGSGIGEPLPPLVSKKNPDTSTPQKADGLQRKKSTLAAPSHSEKNSCTTDQIFVMQESGLSNEQIKRACD